MEKTGKYETKKMSGLKKALGIGALALASFLPMKQANGQDPNTAYEHVVYPFSQPSISQPTGPLEELNWYGSGDVNRDEGEKDIINQADVSRLEQVINGTYTNSQDIRLKDRGDVNGDEVVDNQDKTILQNYVNGTRAYLPAYRNKLQTPEEVRDWLQKIINIARLNETCKGLPGTICDCKEFGEAGVLKLHGVSERNWNVFVNSNPINYIYEEFKKDNGRFNWPVYEMEIQDYNPDGTIFGAHAMNWVAKEEDALDWNQNFKIEPQGNAIIEIGEWYLGTVTDSSLVRIRGPPTIKDELPLFTDLGVYSYFYISNKIPTYGGNAHKDFPWSENAIPFLDKKDHNNPVLSFEEPKENNSYFSPPNLKLNVEDETIFDRFRYINPVYNDENVLISHDGKEYYNNHIWASVDSGKNWVSLLKKTNKNIEEIFERGFGNGDYELLIKAIDMQGNETLNKRKFKIGNQTGLEDRISDIEYWVESEQNAGITRVHYPENKKATHYILNSAGGLVDVIQDNDGNGVTEINLSDKPNGIYIDRQMFEDGTSNTEKIVNVGR